MKRETMGNPFVANEFDPKYMTDLSMSKEKKKKPSWLLLASSSLLSIQQTNIRVEKTFTQTEKISQLCFHPYTRQVKGLRCFGRYPPVGCSRPTPFNHSCLIQKNASPRPGNQGDSERNCVKLSGKQKSSLTIKDSAPRK